ncbi:MAG: T9SS type A sorting domain-containing protein [Bacteroidetes bacterium]|nr:T9SS type A sorting domain-containing protein [Bacteroidota bacterium]
MRKFYFTFLCVTAFLFNVQAQYIFNGCNNRPDYGDSLKGTTSQYDSTGIAPGSSGANITWNYTNLTLNNTKLISHLYKDPAKTKDTSASGSPLFPAANLADLTPNGFNSYYQYTPDSVTYLGNYKDVHTYELVFGSEKQNICPLSFGNSYYNSFSVHPIGVCTHNSYINRTTTYDAYGTLNISKSSYAVARIKIVEQEIDSSCTPNIPPEFKYDTTYVWFDINTGQPVFSWKYYCDTNLHYINKYVEGYSYSHLPATVVTSVQPVDEQKSQFIVYPNPASAYVAIEGTSKSDKVCYSICNMLGAEIKAGEISSSGNSFKGNIPVSELANGMYMLKVTDGTNAWTKKLNKQ